MTVQVTTRHSEDFDIHTETIDPAMSSYAGTVPDYVAKVKAFYSDLKIRSAMWTVPAAERPAYLEPCKPVEYLLELDENRIVAYVNSHTWSDYLFDKRNNFDYSTTPTQYEMTSILIHTPIRQTEVKEFRRYRQMKDSLKYELVKKIRF